MSLRVPGWADVKAFYAFPALVPFSALAAVGWNWLGQKHRTMRTVLWVVLLVWVMTVYAAFWIRHDNPETCRVRGLCQIAQHHYAEAIGSFSQALQLNPDDADAHCLLATAFLQSKPAVEAVRHYREALRIRPDFPEALNHLALILATSKDAGIRDRTRRSTCRTRLRTDTPRNRAISAPWRWLTPKPGGLTKRFQPRKKPARWRPGPATRIW